MFLVIIIVLLFLIVKLNSINKNEIINKSKEMEIIKYKRINK